MTRLGGLDFLAGGLVVEVLCWTVESGVSSESSSSYENQSIVMSGDQKNCKGNNHGV